ncbi:MAG: carbamoyltransferase HypF [Candidatus Zapsychrus exili]|nr:carbamoyltransferase HypF [Candidatus Zapsychrus exili]
MIDIHPNNFKRISLQIEGQVQGVGFRPFIYNLAKELKLHGWVLNSSAGIVIEAEGMLHKIEEFLIRIKQDKPVNSKIHSFKYVYLDVAGYKDFKIDTSNSSEAKTTIILPDIATCPECQEEFFNPDNRRYLYPFTNCTHCGPRYSIIEVLPYDRSNTSMKIFKMCQECEQEYDDPTNRRFHAQPNACNKCGPQIVLWNKKGEVLSSKAQAINDTVSAINEGKIVAVKGLGGFHLVVGAENIDAIFLLRERKNREEKPFALMYPNIDLIKQDCFVSRKEEELLLSVEATIVILKKKDNAASKEVVAPNNPYLGIMLPYTPLHHILLKSLNKPIVATSANLADEPICIDEHEALARLENIADLFLVHNRTIVHHADDSIVRVVAARPLVLRRARGYAPLGIHLKTKVDTVLAVGPHLKNTVALAVSDNVFISQHLGDLETKQSLDVFKKTINDLTTLYEATPTKIAHDAHPEYLSTKEALKDDWSDKILAFAGMTVKKVAVQHHHAHIVSCMSENHVDDTVLGISFDGTGFGPDETIWGGEFLISTLSDFKRVGHIKTFVLPGGETAIKEPRRSALGLLYSIFEKDAFDLTNTKTLQAFSKEELDNIKIAFEKKINSPVTSSAGRLFDAVASIVGLRQVIRYEGQAAMELEYVLNETEIGQYDFSIIKENDTFVIDFDQMIKGIIEDVDAKVGVDIISIKFHNTLINSAVEVAKSVPDWGLSQKTKKVVLSGGCFQNKYLTENLIDKLQSEGFQVYWHQSVPPNDGGISLGQAIVAAQRK